MRTSRFIRFLTTASFSPSEAIFAGGGGSLRRYFKGVFDDLFPAVSSCFVVA